MFIKAFQRGSCAEKLKCIGRLRRLWSLLALRQVSQWAGPVPDALPLVLAALDSSDPALRYAAQGFVREAMGELPHLLHPLFARILKGASTQRTEEEAEAGESEGDFREQSVECQDIGEAIEAALKGFRLLQLLLQCEGQLLVESMQYFFIDERLLQLNAAQAGRLAAHSVDSALGVAAEKDEGMTPSGCESLSLEGAYEDAVVVDYTDLFCVVALRFIALRTPSEAEPPPRASGAGDSAFNPWSETPDFDEAVPAASDRVAAVRCVAAELLCSFFSAMRPPARAKEVACLCAVPLLRRLRALQTLGPRADGVLQVSVVFSSLAAKAF